MMRRIFLLLFLLLFSLSLGAEENLSIVASDSNPVYTNPDHTGLVDRIARETFSRAGISVVFGHLPSERAIRNVEEGLDDGDILRIEGLETIFPNLVRMGESWINMDFVAFSRDPHVRIAGWEDLKNRDVAFIKGWKIFETQDFQAARVDRVVDALHLFRLMQLGRTEVILYDRLQGLYLAKKHGIQVHLQKPFLATRPIYLYLNKRHQSLIPRLDAALRAMKEDGSYQRILEQGLIDLGVGP